MSLVLACVLTVLGTLWTPEHGFQMQAVNESQMTAHVTTVRVVFLRPGVEDTGTVPDPANMLRQEIPVLGVQDARTGAALTAIKPGAQVYIDFAAAFDESRLIDADAICEDPT